MKTCTRCGFRLPIDAFVVDRRTSTGRGARCRGCEVERQRRYHAEHGDAFNARRRERYAALPPGERYDRENYLRHRERECARQRAAYAKKTAAVDERRELVAEAFDRSPKGRRIAGILEVNRGRLEWMVETGRGSVRESVLRFEFTRDMCEATIRALEGERADAIREIERKTRLKGSKQDERRKAA